MCKQAGIAFSESDQLYRSDCDQIIEELEKSLKQQQEEAAKAETNMANSFRGFSLNMRKK